jgi:hypothetical protein
VLGGDPRPNGFMAVSFIFLSALGVVVFFNDGDWPVGLLFIGLTAVYVSELFASLGVHEVAGTAGEEPQRTPTRLGEQAEQALGFCHIVTGLWLIYLVWAATLNAAAGSDLPL